MGNPIVECIANYSAARRPEVLEEIAAAITGVRGVFLLDRHSDDDHNRTVLTFAGPPQPVLDAAFRSIETAARLINLDEHSGEHPRIGATDVVPFVPIRGVSMADCVALAEQLGERVGRELDIPVYLYEEAARIPARRNLEDVRRGQYEGLKQEIGVDPARKPDFGPERVGPAGATVIGARQPLIAYNVYLTTSDVSIARKIALAVRHSSGGLRFVKGLGLEVDGQAQVSMNLTNYRRTPIARVVEFIRREAQRYGVGIAHSELVGLIPQEALVDAAVWYTQLDQFEPEQILERRLEAAASSAAGPAGEDEHPKRTGAGFLEALAEGKPTPGGGSASAYSAAAGAALVSMVARLTIGKRKYATVEAEMQAIEKQAESLRADLLAAVQEDAAAFQAVMAAFKLPKDSPEEQVARTQAIQEATLHAAQVPLRVARQAVEVLSLASKTAAQGNLNAITDGATGAALARAALTGAGYNVRINLFGLKDAATSQQLLAELQALEMTADGLQAEINQQLQSRAGLEVG